MTSRTSSGTELGRDLDEWHGWDVDRAVVAFSAVMYAGMWMQLSLMHWSGGFKHRAMWAPVVATPLFAAAAAAGAVSRGGTFGWGMAAVLGAGVLLGVTGMALHIRGVTSQIGGFTLRNLLSGPPPVLPMAYALVGVLGLGALVWHA